MLTVMGGKPAGQRRIRLHHSQLGGLRDKQALLASYFDP
jgi:hypothetical protein